MCYNEFMDGDNMYIELGKKIKLLRKRRNLKQDDLANILNISRAQISNLEKGRRSLNLEQLNKLCIYFKIDMSYFLSEETTEECISLIDRAKLLFESNKISNKQKEDLFTSIMKIYLDSKKQ